MDLAIDQVIEFFPKHAVINRIEKFFRLWRKFIDFI